MTHPTPITVFTGYLGSGKTTIILELVNQLPPDYNLVMLKNEFGNVAVDSSLAENSHIRVTEMTNGCLCCVLVGKMERALEELLEKYKPDRIIIETSGSAYPAPIALQIRQMDQKKVSLDSIITVIDAKNFTGYKDKSYTAKIQAQFTDLILINKHENIPETELETTLDDVYELNPNTPKIKTDHGRVSPDLIFGLDTKLFTTTENTPTHNPLHHALEVDLLELVTDRSFTQTELTAILESIDTDYFYRIKGIIKSNEKTLALNYVAGDFTFTELTKPALDTKIVFMGHGIKSMQDYLAKKFNIPVHDVQSPIENQQ